MVSNRASHCRLEMGLGVLLQLREILNAVVLRLEVRQSVNVELHEVRNGVALWLQMSAGCAGQANRACGDDGRLVAPCMRPLPLCGRLSAYTDWQCMITHGYIERKGTQRTVVGQFDFRLAGRGPKTSLKNRR